MQVRAKRKKSDNQWLWHGTGKCPNLKENSLKSEGKQSEAEVKENK